MTNDSVSMELISQKVRNFLFEHYLFGYNENTFCNDFSFLDYGVLDSLGILELITFIENEFGITVSDAEILPENMDSVDCVSRFVMKKMCQHDGEVTA